MTTHNILICDDREDVGQRWCELLEGIEALSSRFDVMTLSAAALAKALADLERRRSSARKDSASLGDSVFDQAAILIVDYDLLDLPDRSFYTGESVAYLARCYSQCDLIICVNQFGPDNFDLTLRGSPSSFADVNIGDQQLANPGLWQDREAGWEIFRPWSWPLLPIALERFRKRTAHLATHLDTPIFDYLGFPADLLHVLPRPTVEFVELERSIQSTTFRRFVSESDNGLHRKDEPASEESVQRIAAARLGKWLESVVLPAQDVLIDAPHLAARFPSLLTGEDLTSIETWNRTVDHSFGPLHRVGLKYKTLADHHFARSEWLSRHVWFGRSIRDDESITNMLLDHPADAGDFVFAEDRSVFIDRADATSFVADLPGPHSRRYVGEVEGVTYTPHVRFTL